MKSVKMHPAWVVSLRNLQKCSWFLIPHFWFLISDFSHFPKMVQKSQKGKKNRERFPSVGTLGTSPAQPSDGLRNGPTRSEVVIFGVAGVRWGWVGTRYFILVPRPPQMAQNACKMRPRAKCTFCPHSTGQHCTFLTFFTFYLFTLFDTFYVFGVFPWWCEENTVKQSFSHNANSISPSLFLEKSAKSTMELRIACTFFTFWLSSRLFFYFFTFFTFFTFFILFQKVPALD